MSISVVALLLFYLLISTTSTGDYRNVGFHTLGLSMFWFFGMFSVPVFVVFLDVIGNYISLFAMVLMW